MRFYYGSVDRDLLLVFTHNHGQHWTLYIDKHTFFFDFHKKIWSIQLGIKQKIT